MPPPSLPSMRVRRTTTVLPAFDSTPLLGEGPSTHRSTVMVLPASTSTTERLLPTFDIDNPRTTTLAPPFTCNVSLAFDDDDSTVPGSPTMVIDFATSARFSLYVPAATKIVCPASVVADVLPGLVVGRGARPAGLPVCKVTIAAHVEGPPPRREPASTVHVDEQPSTCT